jgi:hypothetical protein
MVSNLIYQNLYFFDYCILKEWYIYKVTSLKNALFHNKMQLKKGYFVKEIDPLEVFSQRKRPF